MRSFSVEMVRGPGYRVLEARDRATALRLLDAHEVDLLFTDVVLPGGMNGREIANQALRRRPKLKVLFTTGYTRNACIVHHGRLDADVEVVFKPFTYFDPRNQDQARSGPLKRGCFEPCRDSRSTALLTSTPRPSPASTSLG